MVGDEIKCLEWMVAEDLRTFLSIQSPLGEKRQPLARRALTFRWPTAESTPNPRKSFKPLLDSRPLGSYRRTVCTQCFSCSLPLLPPLRFQSAFQALRSDPSPPTVPPAKPSSADLMPTLSPTTTISPSLFLSFCRPQTEPQQVPPPPQDSLPSLDEESFSGPRGCWRCR